MSAHSLAAPTVMLSGERGLGKSELENIYFNSYKLLCIETWQLSVTR